MNDADLKNQGDQEEVCFGTSCVLPANAVFSDARPREMFIAACFLLPIIGIGLYPKLATQMYDVKTVAVNTQVRQSYIQIAQANPQIYASELLIPKIADSQAAPVLGTVK